MFGFDAGQLALMIPVLALAIPIVAILTQHQQRMANILNSKENNQEGAHIEALRREVAELKQIVHQQSIAIDNLANASARVAPMEDRLQNRIG